jgi:hypothetical protein
MKKFIVQCDRSHPAYLHILAHLCDGFAKAHGIFVPSFVTQYSIPIMTLNATIWRKRDSDLHYERVTCGFSVDETMDGLPVRAMTDLDLGMSVGVPVRKDDATEEWEQTILNLSHTGKPFLVVKDATTLPLVHSRMMHIRYGAVMRMWHGRDCTGHWDEVRVENGNHLHSQDNHKMRRDSTNDQ